MKTTVTIRRVILNVSVGILLFGSLNPAVARRSTRLEHLAQVCTTNPVVTTNSDGGAGSLRLAVVDACAGSTITFSVTGTIPLDGGQITLDRDLTIQGPGAELLTIHNMAAPSTASRVFWVNPGVTATLAGLTISGGYVFDDAGGGIYNNGRLTVIDAIVADNIVDHPPVPLHPGVRHGGGIYTATGSALTVVHSTISHNDAWLGGGVYNAFGSVTIIDSTISHNSAAFSGGGIVNDGVAGVGVMSVTGSTISENETRAASLSSDEAGAGIFNTGTLTLNNSTVSGNRAFAGFGISPLGGGIYTFGSLTLISTTITNNSAEAPGFGSGIYGAVHSRNSIIAGNLGVFGADVFGTVTSLGHNLIGTTVGTTIAGDTTGNILNQNALLAPLADNGGPTQTHALLPNSPALDAGESPASTPDQRGSVRPVDRPPANVSDGSDIGAFELGGVFDVPYTTITSHPTAPSNSGAASFSFTATDPLGTGIAGFECGLDGSGFTACASGHTYTSLPDGSHTFVVRAIGNEGVGTTASFTWTIDTAPPETTIDGRPSNPSGVNAVFAFSGTDVTTGIAGFECELDGGGASTCTSPKIYAGLTPGGHTFQVRAVDGAGYVDPVPASFTWNVDPLFCTTNPVVTNTLDNTVGSLRLVVADACAGSTITFSVTGTIPLESGQITLDKDLTIQGPGAELLTVHNIAAPSTTSRVFRVNPGVTATIAGLTISGGYIFDDAGGGIYNNGQLTVTDAIVTQNIVAHPPVPLHPGVRHGGGIYTANGSTLMVVRSTISHNDAWLGGGVYNAFGSVTIIDSTISHNSAAFSGGGIVNDGVAGVGVMSVTGSTISENETRGVTDEAGAGIFNNGTLTLTNATVSGNRVPDVQGSPRGAGIYSALGSLTLISATITNNSIEGPGVGSGIYGAVHSRNSIIAGNLGVVAADVFGTVTSLGHNLIGTTVGTTIAGDTTGNILNQNALLAPLADNGGPTFTHALLAGSPAIDAGDTANAPPNDQRGAARLGPADIGAFELNDSAPNTPPSAVDDAYGVNEDTTLDAAAAGVLGNDTDGENDALTAILQTSPAHADAFSFNGDGSFSYTPNPNFNGTDSFTYTASDGALASAAATVTITVNAVNDNPTAVDDAATVAEDSGANAINVLGNDSTAPDTNETLTITAVTQGVTGSVAISNGGASLTYTPNANGSASDSFTYTISDGNGGTASGSVSVTITPVNDAPTIVASPTTRPQNGGAVNSLIAVVNDIDDAENSLIVTVNNSTSATINGVTLSNIAVDAAGHVTADVSAACGASNASFTLKVTDPGGATAVADLNVTVTRETTPPVIDPTANVVVELPENSSATSLAVTFPLPTASDNCSTPTVATSPASGSQFPIGTTTVQVTATDAVGNQSVSSFTVTVLYRFTGFFQPVDNLPTVNIVSAGQGVPIKLSLSGYRGTNVIAAGYPLSALVACDATEPGSAVEETVSAGGGLSYDPTTDQYVYVWKTNKSWKGTCQTFVMKLNDGSLHSAKFRFK